MTAALEQIDPEAGEWNRVDEATQTWGPCPVEETRQWLHDYTWNAAREVRRHPRHVADGGESRLNTLRDRVALRSQIQLAERVEKALKQLQVWKAHGRLDPEAEKLARRALIAIPPDDPAAPELRALVEELEAIREEHAEASLMAEKQRAREEEDYRAAALMAEKQRAREEESARQQRFLTRPAPKPDPQPFGVSHDGAERLACAWMRHLGVLDAEVTKFTGDGGLDVVSAEYVAQVKNYVGSVPIAQIREIFGVATAEGKHALLFTSGAFSSEGFAFADRVGMGLFHYDAEQGTLEGLNAIANHAVERSIPEAFAQEAR